ncbi:MAG: 1-acyl-sn-glycerol-3-phosphate acyltransferase [Anaerolineales bacterium]|nr:1-acyl-sn-glycerol-3-phosphate acyltransferase [Anaerolineales bacterium]MCX7607654.1 1-acyl-sn-glycerol-3-phosphate acyltransferase [Anaerolineales bacterium]
MSRPLEQLTEINLDDLVEAFGWKEKPRAALLLRLSFRAPARKFARWILTFDEQTGRENLPAAARALLARATAGLNVQGREHVPESGPVLFLANHPGMTDTLCLFSAIGRIDLRIIALERPFLKALPNVAELLFYVSDNPTQRMRAVRQGTAHLRQGGALLTFPAGQIEPDPAVYPGARRSLQNWTDSAGVFLRFVPETCVVPTLVSGVLWEKAVLHPLTRFKPPGREREKLGAALQLLVQVIFEARPTRPTVRFGRPICAADLGTTDLEALHTAVLDEMNCLLDEVEERDRP